MNKINLFLDVENDWREFCFSVHATNFGTVDIDRDNCQLVLEINNLCEEAGADLKNIVGMPAMIGLIEILKVYKYHKMNVDAVISHMHFFSFAFAEYFQDEIKEFISAT